jgi:hypothetical protein
MIVTRTSKIDARTAVVTITTAGISTSGCSRKAASTFLVLIRAQSATRARLRPAVDKVGACPMRAPARSRRSATFRCDGVSPGSR